MGKETDNKYKEISGTRYLEICEGLIYLFSDRYNVPEILKELVEKLEIQIENIVPVVYGEGWYTGTGGYYIFYKSNPESYFKMQSKRLTE